MNFNSDSDSDSDLETLISGRGLEFYLAEKTKQIQNQQEKQPDEQQDKIPKGAEIINLKKNRTKRKPTSNSTNKNQFLNKKKQQSKSYSLKELSKISGVNLEYLQEVYNRGIGAWKTNPQSVRSKSNPSKKNVTLNDRMSAEQWAYARVYSFLNKGKTYRTTDNDIAKKAGY